MNFHVLNKITQYVISLGPCRSKVMQAIYGRNWPSVGVLMIDLNELRLVIRNMTRKQGLYRVLRDELKGKGHWKDLPRGKADIYHVAGRRRPQTTSGAENEDWGW